MQNGPRLKDGAPETALRDRGRPSREARRRRRHRQLHAERTSRGILAKKNRLRELVRGRQDHGIISVSRAARVSGVTPRAIHDPPRRAFVHRLLDEVTTRVAVPQVALDFVTYGRRREWAMLCGEGRPINRRRVCGQMKKERLLQPAHLPWPRLPSAGILATDRPNQKSYSDLTYVDTTTRGPCPLTSILAGWTREVVGWSLLPNCGATGRSTWSKRRWRRSSLAGSVPKGGSAGLKPASASSQTCFGRA